MGLLDQLWDDTLAGPAQETGLGKLRKRPAFSFWSRSDRNGGERQAAAAAAAAEAEEEEEEEPRVTKSIKIRRPEAAPGGGTPPISPAGSTPPASPFSGGGGGKEWDRFRRKSSSDMYERPAGMVGVGPGSPPPYEV